MGSDLPSTILVSQLSRLALTKIGEARVEVSHLNGRLKRCISRISRKNSSNTDKNSKS